MATEETRYKIAIREQPKYFHSPFQHTLYCCDDGIYISLRAERRNVILSDNGAALGDMMLLTQLKNLVEKEDEIEIETSQLNRFIEAIYALRKHDKDKTAEGACNLPMNEIKREDNKQ